MKNHDCTTDPDYFTPPLIGKRLNRVIVIGGGIVGLATAYTLQKEGYARQVTVLEKEFDVARHQSSRNSGVLHAGLYYRPGSLKARLATQGIRSMIAFCTENDIPFRCRGKMVVATHTREVPILEQLFENGMKNGLVGLKKLGLNEIQEIEPHVTGQAAILVPEEGVVDYEQVTMRLRDLVVHAGGEILTKFEVAHAVRSGISWQLFSTDERTINADLVINCAGLYSDKIAEMFGIDSGIRIIPFRGHYYRLVGDAIGYVKGLVYPVPDPKFPFLGVHAHRRIDGTVEAGPNAVLAFAREGYHLTDVNIPEMVEAIGHPGLLRFMLRHKKEVMNELRSGFDKSYFVSRLQSLFPEIQSNDLQPGGTGVRAQAMDKKGNLIQDFVIQRGPGSIHVINAPSPGATASLAIAKHITRLIPS